MASPEQTALDPNSSVDNRAVANFLRRENPLGFETDIREFGYDDYGRYSPHVLLLIRNGASVSEIADHFQKLMMQRFYRSDREKAVALALKLSKELLPSNKSLERTREG